MPSENASLLELGKTDVHRQASCQARTGGPSVGVGVEQWI